MNIALAKEQIKNAMTAYFSRDRFGGFMIPVEEQRPVFLMGPPGIGKTAIMKQVAEELGGSLVSYSMTHHTRQSVLGLPMIVKKNYGGMDVSATEYTMSEIIAEVYDTIESTGRDEGILFLDEINCVSETLTPVMLQFLQFKTFGRHRIPEGWIVGTAGNPPEYNRSAKEFDIVTWDRLKRIDIEPDYSAWKPYALKKGVHPSVTTYLDAKKDNFYRVELTAEGRQFVTARGWTDLSEMIKLYELNGIAVDALLISQYIRIPEIAEDFARYYDLFNKYRSDYRLGEILAGRAPEEICSRAAKAPFDERMSLIGLMLDSVGGRVKEVIDEEDIISLLLPALKAVKTGTAISVKAEEMREMFRREERRGAVSPEKRLVNEAVMEFLEKHERAESSFADIKAEYDGRVRHMRELAAVAGAEIENLFAFAEKVWREGQEVLIILSEMTISARYARFISRYGCPAYYRHSEELMFRQRRIDIIRRIEELDEKI